MTEVAAALIWSGDRFMICKRPRNKARGLLWEFPGGKLEPGETAQEALLRECKEELDIELEVGGLFTEVVYSYPDIDVHLMLFNSAIASGQVKKIEHEDIRWITREEIPKYDFCPADADILEKLQKR